MSCTLYNRGKRTQRWCKKYNHQAQPARPRGKRKGKRTEGKKERKKNHWGDGDVGEKIKDPKCCSAGLCF